MADKYMSNYAARYNSDPLAFYPKGHYNSHMKVMYDEFNLSEVVGNGDLIYSGKLPIGAKIHNVILTSTDMDGTGQFQVGTIADPDRYIAALDAGDAAAIGEMVDAVHAGQFEELSVETEIVVKCIEASTATSGKIKLAVHYVID
jgi:hypothetical protein